MDNELLQSLIELVKTDKDRKNTYKDFDKLLITLTEEEIAYFLMNCDEDVFKNHNLCHILIRSIPKTFGQFIDYYTNYNMDMIHMMKKYMDKELRKGKIGKKDYKKNLKKYKAEKKDIKKFREKYFNEIDKVLKNN
jgi:hypothetical protein